MAIGYATMRDEINIVIRDETRKCFEKNPGKSLSEVFNEHANRISSIRNSLEQHGVEKTWASIKNGHI